MNQKSSQREGTKSALLNALQAELLESTKLTVEGVALRAGVNKALVYRYFGGLNGLISAFGDSDAFMPSAQELLALCPSNLSRLSARERLAACLQAYIKSFLQRPAAVQILLRTPFFDREVVTALQEGRTREMAAVRQAFHADELPELGFDLDIGLNVLIAGICFRLGEAHRLSGWGVPNESLETTAQRLATTVAAILREPKSRAGK